MDGVIKHLLRLPLAGLFVFLLIFYLFGDTEKLLYRVADDAAYYFEIAENIAAGNGPTFDGISSLVTTWPAAPRSIAAFGIP